MLFTVCDGKTDFISPWQNSSAWQLDHLPSFSSHWGTEYHLMIGILLYVSNFYGPDYLKRNLFEGPELFFWSGALFTHEYRCNKQLWSCRSNISHRGSLNPGDIPSGCQWKWWHLADQWEPAISQHFSSQDGKKILWLHNFRRTLLRCLSLTPLKYAVFQKDPKESRWLFSGPLGSTREIKTNGQSCVDLLWPAQAWIVPWAQGKMCGDMVQMIPPEPWNIQAERCHWLYGTWNGWLRVDFEVKSLDWLTNQPSCNSTIWIVRLDSV